MEEKKDSRDGLGHDPFLWTDVKSSCHGDGP